MKLLRQLVLVVVGTFAGCVGEGSDIGPFPPDLPVGSCKVLVFDDEGRGVVGAQLRGLASNLRCTTGRNGRGDFGRDVRGRVRLYIEGEAAAARNGDELASLVVASTVSERDFPAPFYLPDLAGSAGLPLSIGMQNVGAVLDDLASSGARVQINAGTVLGIGRPLPDFVLRTAALQPAHLPGDLPVASSGAWLFGRGIYVDPPDLVCVTPLDLEVVDDLQAASGAASLFRQDYENGEWELLADGLSATGGLLQAPAAIVRGGLYAFAVPVVAGSITGRIVDAATPPQPVAGAMVVVDGRPVLTSANGSFVAEGVAAATGAGTRRAAIVEVHAGGAALPAVLRTEVTMNVSAVIAAGDLVLDTMPAGTLYVQMVRRGRADPLRRCGISSLFGGEAQVVLGDAEGQAVFEDVPARWFGFQTGYPNDRDFIFYAQGVSFLPPGRRWQLATQFLDRRVWWNSPRNLRVLVTDDLGGGPLEGAVVVRGRTPGSGLQGTTREGGVVFATRDVRGRFTASRQSAADGHTLVYALSIERPSSGTLEFPLQQQRRRPLAAFDRHGLVQGSLQGADPARDHELRSTRRFEPQEWWEVVAEGRPELSRLPLDIDPAVTHEEFRVGVARGGGHLVALETSSNGGVTTLHKLGLRMDLQVAEASVAELQLPLAQVADTNFVAAGVLAALDPALDPTALRCDLLLQQPAGLGVDVARGLGGNLSANGDDLLLTLPALSGVLQGHRWLALVRGEAQSGGVTIQQAALQRFGGTPATAPFLPVPQILAPAPGAMVDPAGFTVDFALPAGSLCGLIELRSEEPAETLLWQAYVPPSISSFAFVSLPTQAATPLRAGKTYRLSVTAFRNNRGVLVGSDRPYSRLTGTLQSIGKLEAGIDAFAVCSIDLQTN